MGVPSHKLIVADSGVNIKNLSNSLGSKRIGLNKNITFGYAGGLQPERDIDNLILVASKNLSVNFLFIGGREKLVKELQEKAQESGATNIEFLGYLKFSDMRKVLINRCDGMLYTRAKGKHEENSSPLKLFDYFNYEKPIVCANTSTTKEYINYQGIFGYVPSSISSLNDAIHECIVCIQNGGRVDSELIDFAKEKSWVARQKNILDKAGLL
ncbi:glycosyltransferase [Vibrio rotiferianus]|uniref:glycosyltransferase n=1 Tax=Vibrio rotiferianus TaxID=190895 RepID=UPI0015F443F1|nr:glycosyltransferase [Vibrio rotiferianus]